MGKLWDTDITSIMRTYDIRRFVETGTGTGDSLLYACNLPFITLWSCEIEKTVAMVAKSRLNNDPRITLFISNSSLMLPMLAGLPVDEPILFWLDAHYPGADYGIRGYGDEPDQAIKLPLNTELTLIRGNRPQNADVIIIDDARIWMDEPFENGPVPPQLWSACCPDERGIDFIEQQFSETHKIEISHKQEGQIILFPKKDG